MSIFPSEVINVTNLIDSTVITPSELPLVKEYAWDFENNDFLLVDGKNAIVTGKEAIKVWVWKALQTKKYRYRAYTSKYGHELDSLINQGFSTGALKAELERYLKESLLVNVYITGVKTIDITIDGSKTDVSFTVTTVYGEVSVSV
ncbi:DUF2634 domain-containing protein [Desulfosporosinus lacus]|uniref:Phage protein XkdS n=1 Tax=Desulfosporosinus lacus DSM 15449 TaxID=1121420 RepID=A0A1M5QM61_9FIRM|nr:DUF2634 domain-containing protein [Desulfosporosinus lacus]SHH15026.1 Protein of unknown function [Desulfosporosinus lacus DSM 15449]